MQMTSKALVSVDTGGAQKPHEIYLRQFLTLARNGESLSPLRIARLIWGGLTSIAAQPKIIRLLRLEPYTQIAQGDPRFAFKYVTLEYLAHGMSTSERAACFLWHYNRLHATLPNLLLRDIMVGAIPIFEICEDHHRFAITIGMSRPANNEGEMSLSLLVDDEIVFILGFTIVPGWVVKSKAREVLLISRIQGMRGRFDEISLATKILWNVAPSPLLLAAMQGFGEAFGINELAGVSSTTHRYAIDDEHAPHVESAYDGFFEALGVTRTPNGYFSSPIPMKEKPLALIKRGHKIRTKQKRAFKEEVQNAFASFFKEQCAAASPLFKHKANECAMDAEHAG
jgi:uncharacterized protein VirK/YbjX